MPTYFIERYDSFRYLLEQWGFYKLSRGRDRGAYYHVNFVRGNRKKIAKATKEGMNDAMPSDLSRDNEPNLYEMVAELESQNQSRSKTRAAKAAVESKTQASETSIATKAKRPSRDSKESPQKKRQRSKSTNPQIGRAHV